jgi:hypothetical protein
MVMNAYHSNEPSYKVPFYFSVKVIADCAHNKVNPPADKTFKAKIGVLNAIPINGFTTVVSLPCYGYTYTCTPVTGILACNALVYTI